MTITVRIRRAKGASTGSSRAARLLRKHRINFATLSSINRVTAKYPLQVYRFLRDEVGAKRLQFIPIVEPVGFWYTPPQYWKKQLLPVDGSPQARPGHPDSMVEDWCVDPDDWGGFSAASSMSGTGRTWARSTCIILRPRCTQAPLCGKGLALEHDGSVYACDHYVGSPPFPARGISPSSGSMVRPKPPSTRAGSLATSRRSSDQDDQLTTGCSRRRPGRV